MTDSVLAGILKGSAVVLGAWVVAVEVTDFPISSSLPSILGYSVIGPAMFWAYRTVSRANTSSKEEAWTIVKRLRAELDRARSENDRLTARLKELSSGNNKGE